MPYNVVLRADIADLSGRRQISYALKALIKAKRIVRLGYGIYGKAYQSSYIDLTVLKGGFAAATREALTRLHVPWEPGSAEQEYNIGQSTQIPMSNTVKIKSRFSRRLSYRDMTLSVEKSAE